MLNTDLTRCLEIFLNRFNFHRIEMLRSKRKIAISRLKTIVTSLLYYNIYTYRQNILLECISRHKSIKN